MGWKSRIQKLRWHSAGVGTCAGHPAALGLPGAEGASFQTGRPCGCGQSLGLQELRMDPRGSRWAWSDALRRGPSSSGDKAGCRQRGVCWWTPAGVSGQAARRVSASPEEAPLATLWCWALMSSWKPLDGVPWTADL